MTRWLEQNIGCMALSKDEMAAVRQTQRLYHAYQIVETDRTFTYDAAGKLLTATETEDNYGTCVYI